MVALDALSVLFTFAGGVVCHRVFPFSSNEPSKRPSTSQRGERRLEIITARLISRD